MEVAAVAHTTGAVGAAIAGRGERASGAMMKNVGNEETQGGCSIFALCRCVIRWHMSLFVMCATIPSHSTHNHHTGREMMKAKVSSACRSTRVPPQHLALPRGYTRSSPFRATACVPLHLPSATPPSSLTRCPLASATSRPFEMKVQPFSKPAYR